MSIRLTRLFGLIGSALMALAVLLAAALPAAAETAEARPAAWQKADALLSGLIETNGPGLAVLVAQHGKILFERNCGLADREHHVPVISQTTFRIGSIGKQFTASAILKLQEEGKLSVNDKLSKYIPDFPRGDEVTLRHLLSHTSGIKDYIGDDLSNQTNTTTTEAIIETIKKDSYDFEPGAKWRYDNSGYTLLGYIVEKVSGQSYGDFLRENFFQPLGMTNTGVYRAQLGLPHEALGYSLGTNGFKRALNWDMSWAAGAGALYSTVEDLYRWNEGIFNGRGLDAASLKTAFTPVKTFENQLNSDTGYGFGWFIGRHRGLLEIVHGGNLPGFSSFLLHVPDEKFTVTVLANASPGRTNAMPRLLAQQLLDIYLADKLAPLPIVNTNVSPKSYDALTGRYGPVLAGVDLTVSRRGPHLFGQGTDGRPEAEIFPKSETEFFAKVGDNQITFVKDRSGKVVKIVVHTDGSDLVASRVNDGVEAKVEPSETAEALPAASQKADALLSGLIETNDPGLAVLVAQDGKILFEKSYGLADREQQVPVIPQTTFRIGSISKQFTASAILKLQEEGKLSINDKLSKYIPDFPRGDEVTLRHLLSHTSGIHDCRMTPDFLSRVTQPTTTETAIEELKRQTHPYDFDPGTKWCYDNAGYLLLCHIVEEVSGRSYGDFLRENFFQPLGMTNTGVYRAHLGLPHEALGYSLDTNGFRRAVNWDMSWATGSGALYSTVEDLYRWNEGIFNGRGLNAASLKAAFIPVKMGENQLNSDGGYGFGWVIGRHRGLREILHNGGLHGFRCDLLRVPDEKCTVAVLANAAFPGKPNAFPDFLAQQLVDIFLADKLAPLPIVNTNVSPKSYDSLAGRYDLGIPGEILTISRRGTHLFGQVAAIGAPDDELFPKSDTEFFSKLDTQISFVKDSSGKVFKIIVHGGGLDLVAPRVNDVVEEK